MQSYELRKSFLSFFEKRGHQIVPSSSLIPSDPSVLLTTAGMQQFKPYYLEGKSPYGFRVTSCQKCFRTSDIEVVGDETHVTFLEMLGNFSFADYFKEETIEMAYQFLFQELKLPLAEAYFTVFEGDERVPEDKESIALWRKLGIPEDKIKKYGREDNFWGPTGEEGPCGPTTEIYLNGVEIWNLVFNEYYQDKNGKLTPLKEKGVDTGMGLERLAMTTQGKESIYQTDLFEPLMREIKSDNEKAKRIIADHIKGATFLISEGILPSNVERGYLLRRLLRRAMRYARLVNLPQDFYSSLVKATIEIYEGVYDFDLNNILTVIQEEEERFGKVLEAGLKKFEKGLDPFVLYTAYGFPLELTRELAREKGEEVDLIEFEKKFKEHQVISRAGAESKFGGGGSFSPQLHSATHLLQAALRKILGEEVKQMGSDITSERLRFDFSFPRKMTAEEVKEVENLVNQKIKEDLEVTFQEMSYEDALESGALAFFKERYPEKVIVYSFADFSKEICVGPHVKRTSELGNFKIVKEESLGSGLRRIRAVLK